MDWKEYPYIGHLSNQLSGLSYMPLVELELHGLTGTHRASALIDSGSEASMMDMEIAEALGIKIPEHLPITVSGVSGSKRGFSSPVSFKVEGFDDVFTFTVIFVSEPSFDIVLGQQDFFRNFDIEFLRNEGIFRLKRSV